MLIKTTVPLLLTDAQGVRPPPRLTISFQRAISCARSRSSGAVTIDSCSARRRDVDQAARRGIKRH